MSPPCGKRGGPPQRPCAAVEEDAEANILRGTRRSGLRSVALLIEAARLVRWERKTVMGGYHARGPWKEAFLARRKGVDVVKGGPQGGNM